MSTKTSGNAVRIIWSGLCLNMVITQILVKNRAMLNCKDNYCITPLNLAKDCKEIIEYFMNTSTRLLISECEIIQFLNLEI